MLNLNQVIQTEIERNMSDQFLEWELYLPTLELIDNFANLKEDLGDKICSFQATYPVQPRGSQTVVENGTSVQDTSLYSICFLRVPQRITRKHVLKMAGGTQFYALLMDLSDEMIEKTISRVQIKLISDCQKLETEPLPGD